METEKARVVEEIPKELYYFAIARTKAYGNWFGICDMNNDPRDGDAVKRLAEHDWPGYEIKILEVEL